MRVLIDARMYGLENAGIGRYLINLIEGLRNVGDKEYFILLLRKNHFDGLNLPKNWRKVEADFSHYTIEEQVRLPGIINEEKPDLVHFPHLNVPIFWKGKYILTVHDLTMQRQGTDATSLPLPIYFLKRIPFLLVAKKGVKNAMKIIVPSNAVKKDVINYYSIEPERVRVVYEGVTVFGEISKSQLLFSELQEKYNIRKPYFLYIGNAYPHKNLEKAIQALVSLNRNRNKKTTLAIGGSKDVFKKRLMVLVRKYNAQDYIKLLDFVPDEDLLSLYQNSSGFVYPSFSEGFGLQGLEAMLAGTVVLASDIPVFKEIYEDFAFYFNPEDPISIAASMSYVLDLEEDKRKFLIMKSQEFVKKYSWDKMAQETFEVYKERYGKDL